MGQFVQRGGNGSLHVSQWGILNWRAGIAFGTGGLGIFVGKVNLMLYLKKFNDIPELRNYELLTKVGYVSTSV